MLASRRDAVVRSQRSGCAAEDAKCAAQEEPGLAVRCAADAVANSEVLAMEIRPQGC